jgi:hypothetical protein
MVSLRWIDLSEKESKLMLDAEIMALKETIYNLPGLSVTAPILAPGILHRTKSQSHCHSGKMPLLWMS